MAPPTREVFGNIAPWMQTTFYVMMAVSLIVLGSRVARRVRLWRTGRPGGFERDWRVWLSRILTYAIAQKRVHRKTLGGVLHLLLFSGFVVLTIGTTLLMVSHIGPVDFHYGWYYLWYELVMDLFGVAFCCGCAMALYRRLFRRPASLGHDTSDWWLLGAMLAIGVTGFLIEALRISFSDVDPLHARWSFVGSAIYLTFLQQIDLELSRGLHLALWWLHAALVAGLIAAIPVTRMMHAITGPLSIATAPDRPLGALVPVSIEEVEQTGNIGVATIQDFNRQQLLSLDACMECGRCEDACPAWASGKPLSPKRVVLDLRDQLDGGLGAHKEGEPAAGGPLLNPETLWACTMCQACVQSCPVLIGQVDLISDCRRHLVAEGEIAGSPATALRNLSQRANPYGQSGADRAAWAEGLEIPTLDGDGSFEYLLWVGCAGAFDPLARKTARATAQLLIDAGVSVAILGGQEQCTGDPARRIGDEMLFQQLAQTNIERLNQHKISRIVTPCPHCFNTLKNEYPQFGGNFQVLHHTQLLAELVAAGKLRQKAGNHGPITLHDPCYLARVNGEVDAQRQLVRTDHRADFREMPRSGCNTFCCGAGGGRMWFEEAADQRVSKLRAEEALATGAKTVATSCPFCLNMMTDAMATVDDGQDVQVLDVSELLIGSDVNQ